MTDVSTSIYNQQTHLQSMMVCARKDMFHFFFLFRKHILKSVFVFFFKYPRYKQNLKGMVSEICFEIWYRLANEIYEELIYNDAL